MGYLLLQPTPISGNSLLALPGTSLPELLTAHLPQVLLK